jgi:hypothetical protein
MKRAAILVLAFWLFLPVGVDADPISIALGRGQGVSVATTPQAITDTPWAGSLVLTVNGGAYAGLSLLAYCVDLYHWAGWTEDVTIMSTNNLPSGGRPVNVGPDAGLKAAFLYKQFQLGKVLTAEQSAALQVAIWEVLYDTASPDLSGGNFTLRLDGAVASYARQYIEELNASNGAAEGLLFLSTNEDQQSFIALMSVPEPASLLLLGSGLIGFGFFARRRR